VWNPYTPYIYDTLVLTTRFERAIRQTCNVRSGVRWSGGSSRPIRAHASCPPHTILNRRTGPARAGRRVTFLDRALHRHHTEEDRRASAAGTHAGDEPRAGEEPRRRPNAANGRANGPTRRPTPPPPSRNRANPARASARQPGRPPQPHGAWATWPCPWPPAARDAPMGRAWPCRQCANPGA
jgi:hypothetical protein